MKNKRKIFETYVKLGKSTYLKIFWFDKVMKDIFVFVLFKKKLYNLYSKSITEES